MPHSLQTQGGNVFLKTVVLAAAFVGLSSGGIQAADTGREYGKGPLTGDDFQMAAPAPQKGRVATSGAAYVELRADYSTNSNNRDGQGRASLTKVRVTAVVVRDKSWIKDKKTPEKKGLAHEQGRFDLAEVHARQAQARYDQLIADGKLQFTAANEAAAVTLLRQALDNEYQSVQQKFLQEQQQYDTETRQGLQADQQARWRKKLDGLLAPPKP